MRPAFTPAPRPTSLLLAVACLVSFLALEACEPARGPLEIGQEIPAFELERLGGGVLESESLRGEEPIVLNFWATWCGPCVREIPALQQMHREKSARVISIALDRAGASVVAPFAEEHRIDYPVLLGDLEGVARYGVVAIPYTLVLDGDLRLVESYRGLITHHTLERAVAKARAG